MPSIFSKKKNTRCRNRIAFPSEKKISLYLAECTKENLTNMIARLEISNKISKEIRHDMNINQTVKCTVENDVPATSSTNPENSPRKAIKKRKQKKILKREMSVGRTFIKTFKYFSRFGEKNALGNAITYHNTLRWLKKAEILDNHRVTIRDVEVHYINQLKRGYKLKMLAFIRFLKSLSEDRGLLMCNAVTKLLNCRQKKINHKKVPSHKRLLSKKNSKVRKLKAPSQRKSTSNSCVKTAEKILTKSITMELGNGIFRNKFDSVREIQSEKLLDVYHERIENKCELNSAVTDLKIHTPFFNSEEISLRNKPSARWITPTPLEISYETESMNVKKSGLIPYVEEPNAIPIQQLKCSEAKKIALKTETQTQKQNSARVNQRKKNTDRKNNSINMTLKGISLNSHYEEDYEFLTETLSEDSLHPKTSPKQKGKVYRKMAAVDQKLHIKRSFNTKRNSVVQDKNNSESREVVAADKKCIHFNRQKKKVTESTDSAGGKKLAPDMDKVTNKLRGVVSIENITPQIKTGDSFGKQENAAKKLMNPKQKRVHEDKRSRCTELNNNKNSKVIKSCINKASNKNEEKKTKGMFSGLENKDKIVLPICKKKYEQPRTLSSNSESKSSSFKQKPPTSFSKGPLKGKVNSSDIRHTSQLNSKASRQQAIRSSRVKPENTSIEDRNMILKVPGSNKITKNSTFSTTAECQRIRSCVHKKECASLETKNKKHLPIKRIKSPHSPEIKDSSSEYHGNTSVDHLKNSVGINSTFQKTKSSSKKGRTQRTFTNLPVDQVQKSLSQIRKLKLNGTATKKSKL